MRKSCQATSTAMTLDMSPGGSSSNLHSSIEIASAPYCCFALSSAHYPSRALLALNRPALKHPAYRLYDCILACQASTCPWRSTSRTLQPVPGTLTRRVLHEWGQWIPHSCRWRLPCTSRNWLPIQVVKKTHFVAREYEDTALRIQGPAVGQRNRTSRS